MEKINKILNELSDINLDKKCKCMLKGDIQGIAYCQGFESCLQILGYELFKSGVDFNEK